MPQSFARSEKVSAKSLINANKLQKNTRGRSTNIQSEEKRNGGGEKADTFSVSTSNNTKLLNHGRLAASREEHVYLHITVSQTVQTIGLVIVNY